MKKFFKIVTLFTLMVCTKFVFASNSVTVTYEDFIHMPFNQQKEVIHLVHNYLNEMGRIDQVQILKNKKYFTYQKIMNYFLASAYASNLTRSNEKCFYAGWPSRFVERNGEPIYCNHPFLMTDSSIDNEYYQKPENGYMLVTANGDKDISLDENSNVSCKGEQQDPSNMDKYREFVECNPRLYGQVDGKTFCVKAQYKARNASYLCSKAVEKLKETRPDKYNSLMQSIVLASANTPEEKAKHDDHLSNMLSMMYKTCVCGANANQEGDTKYTGELNKDYAHNMYYSRTCFGILSQTKRIKEIAFSEPTACFLNHKIDGSSQTNWREFLTSIDGVMDNAVKVDGFNVTDVSVLKDWDQRETDSLKFCPLSNFKAKPKAEPVKPQEENEKASDAFKLSYNDEDKTLIVTYTKKDPKLDPQKLKIVLASTATKEEDDESPDTEKDTKNSEDDKKPADTDNSERDITITQNTPKKSPATWVLAEQQPKINKGIVIFNVTKGTIPTEVLAQFEVLTSNSVKIPANEPDLPESEEAQIIAEGECKIILDKKQNKDGSYKMEFDITMKDKEESIKDKYDFYIEIFDTLTVERNTEATKTKGIAPDEEEDEDKESGKTAGMSKEAKEKLPEGSNSLGNNAAQEINIDESFASVKPVEAARTISVYVKSKDPKLKCESLVAQEIPALKPDYGTGNDNAVQKAYDSGLFDSGNSGSILMGTR